MAVPKRKKSKSCRNMRRSHHRLEGVNVVEDSTTGDLHRPHHVTVTGHYNKRQVTTDKVNP